jgi:cysteine desulfurase
VAGGDPAPFLRGGSQERGWRPGTHNVASICGAAAAARVARDALADGSAARMAVHRDRIESAAVALGAVVAGAGAPRLPNTTAVIFPGISAFDLVMALDLESVCASAGAACASGAQKPSPVLEAMGLAGSAVRFSVGAGTTEGEVTLAIELLGRCLARARG